jgi:hypothetical protein
MIQGLDTDGLTNDTGGGVEVLSAPSSLRLHNPFIIDCDTALVEGDLPSA